MSNKIVESIEVEGVTKPNIRQRKVSPNFHGKKGRSGAYPTDIDLVRKRVLTNSWKYLDSALAGRIKGITWKQKLEIARTLCGKNIPLENAVQPKETQIVIIRNGNGQKPTTDRIAEVSSLT